MRVLIYADMRSPHARGWVAGLTEAGMAVEAVSSFGHVLSGNRTVLSRRLLAAPPAAQQAVRTVEALARAGRRATVLREKTLRFKPDILHALRLPYEGVTALRLARANRNFPPVVISTWGQDFDPQATHDPVLRMWIKRYLPLARGLHVDSRLDLDRAWRFGFSELRPHLLAAGNFGVRPEIFAPSTKEPLVVFPRGFRGHVSASAFLEAAERITAATNELSFVAVGLSGTGDYTRYRGNPQIILTPTLDQRQFARLLGRSRIIVSPSRSDGMPNSVLESLSAGALPIVGDLPQLRDLARGGAEMIFLRDLSSEAIEEAIIGVSEEQADRAVAVNPRVIPVEYRWQSNLGRVPEFYRNVLGTAAGP